MLSSYSYFCVENCSSDWIIATLGPNFELNLSWVLASPCLAGLATKCMQVITTQPPTPALAYPRLSGSSLFFQVVWCPLPNCSSTRVVPRIKCRGFILCAIAPPPDVVLCLCHTYLALSWILREVENLASSSFQDKMKPHIVFVCPSIFIFC